MNFPLIRRIKEDIAKELSENFDVIIDLDNDINSFHIIYGKNRKKILDLLRTMRYYNDKFVTISKSNDDNISICKSILQPYKMAEENRYYAYKSCNQFMCNYPNIIIYVWDSNHKEYLPSAFDGLTEKFTRAFCRRTFMEFTNDNTNVSQICDKAKESNLSDVSKMIAGIIFLDAATLYGENIRQAKNYIYLNPYANHKIILPDLFCQYMPHTVVDRFQYDTY